MAVPKASARPAVLELTDRRPMNVNAASHHADPGASLDHGAFTTVVAPVLGQEQSLLVLRTPPAEVSSFPA